MRAGLSLLTTSLVLTACAGPPRPAAPPPESAISAGDRHGVWEAVLRFRRLSSRADTSMAVVPQVVMVDTPPDSAEGDWLGSLFADYQLVDGYCRKRSPCECQSDALVPMEFLFLNAPRVWRSDTVEVALSIAGTYPAWATGARLGRGTKWMIGLTDVTYYLVQRDAAWTLIPTPYDPDRALSLVGHRVCEE